MFLMTSSPLQAMEEFSDLSPVTPVGLLLFVSGLNVSFDTNPLKTVWKREHALLCVSVRVYGHTHINESRRQRAVESVVEE